MQSLKLQLQDSLEFISSSSIVDSGLVIESKKEQKKFLQKKEKKVFSQLPRRKQNVKHVGRVGIGAEKLKQSININLPGQMDSPPIHSSVDLTLQTEKEKSCDKIKKTQSNELSMNVSGTIIPEITIRNNKDLKKWIIHNGDFPLSLVYLYSLELNVHKSLLEKISQIAPSFSCGWLYDDIINSYLYQLSLQEDSILFCTTIEAQRIQNGRSIRKLWNDISLHTKSMVLIPMNPTGNHWVLGHSLN